MFKNQIWCKARRRAKWALAAVLLLVPSATLPAQSICGCTDLPSADCNCPGCDAFFQSSPGSLPEPYAPTIPPLAVPPGQIIESPMVEQGTPAPVIAAPGGETQPPTIPQPIPDLGTPALTDGGIQSTPDMAPSMQARPPVNSFASSLGATSGGRGVPGMIGDFFGSGFNYVAFPNPLGVTGNAPVGQNATVAAAGGDRQFKTSENTSPFPRNRVFFNYHRFEDAVNGIDGAGSVDRYVFGLEKTFLQGLASLEVRAPIVRSVTSSPSVLDAGNDFDTQFGNISLAIKGLLYQEANFAASAGLALVLPTGDDFVIQDTVDNIFENGAVHIQPFLGIYHAPSDRLFTQFFTQLDFDAGNSRVLFNGIQDELNQQTLLMLDYSVGYWMVRNRCGFIRSVAPMLELHYTTTLEDQEYGAFSDRGILVQDFRRDVLNLTGGLFTQIGNQSALKVGLATPLRGGTDDLFDYELGVQFVRHF